MVVGLRTMRRSTRRSARWLAGVLLAAAIGCGGGSRAVMAPSGSGERREVLLARVVAEPGDVKAWRELAAEEDRAGRAAAAIDALEQVILRRGPLGDELSLADRRRLGRLLYERGTLRLGRGAASALGDLRRAKQYEWPVKAEELLAAEVAQAVALLKHSEARQRQAGMAKLAELAERPEAFSLGNGAKAQASVGQRAELGRWLWQRGAKRAGYELLATRAERAGTERAGTERVGTRLSDEERDLYLEARAWWAPSWRGDAGLPPAERMTGPRRCALVSPDEAARWNCDVLSVKSATFRSTPEEQDALRALPARPERDAAKASAWVALVVRGYLEGDGWGSKFNDEPHRLARRLDDLHAELARRVDVAWVTAPERREQLAPFARPTLLRLAGELDAAQAALSALVSVKAATGPTATPSKAFGALPSVERLVVAYELILATATAIPPSERSTNPAGAAATASPASPASPGATERPAVAANRAAVDRAIALLPLPEGRGDPPAVMRLRSSVDFDPSPQSPQSPQLAKDRVSRAADEAAAEAALHQLGNQWEPAKKARLVALAGAARRDVAVAHRKAAEHVALSPDAALAWGELGALYLLLDDPAAARAAWQRAVDASDEPAFVHGLALATAAARDPDAALLFLVKAAAASGDPSPWLVEGAEALVAAGSALHALQAAKSAIELATPDTARRALSVAYRASTALGRQDDAAQLVRLGATVPSTISAAMEASGATSTGAGSAQDGSSGNRTDEAAVLEARRRAALADLSSAALVLRWGAVDPSAEATYALWRTTKWNRSNVAVYERLLARLDADDPRRAVVIDSLVALCIDPDRSVVAASVAALRRARD